MKTKLYCHHCAKNYSVSMNDILLMQLHAPLKLESSGLTYSYHGECFFKRLTQIKKSKMTHG